VLYICRIHDIGRSRADQDSGEVLVQVTYIGAVITPWNSEDARDADRLNSTEVMSY
jgi:hypothetical protein